MAISAVLFEILGFLLFGLFSEQSSTFYMNCVQTAESYDVGIYNIYILESPRRGNFNRYPLHLILCRTDVDNAKITLRKHAHATYSNFSQM